MALASSMADPAFRATVTQAVRTTPVVFADGSMTAVLGERWSAKARPTSNTLEAEGVAAYRADDAAWQDGLALVPATVVPHLTDDFRWGRLYAGVAAAPADLAIGVASGSAVVLSPAGARSRVRRSSWPTGRGRRRGPAPTVRSARAGSSSTSSGPVTSSPAEHDVTRVLACSRAP